MKNYAIPFVLSALILKACPAQAIDIKFSDHYKIVYSGVVLAYLAVRYNPQGSLVVEILTNSLYNPMTLSPEGSEPAAVQNPRGRSGLTPPQQQHCTNSFGEYPGISALNYFYSSWYYLGRIAAAHNKKYHKSVMILDQSTNNFHWVIDQPLIGDTDPTSIDSTLWEETVPQGTDQADSGSPVGAESHQKQLYCEQFRKHCMSMDHSIYYTVFSDKLARLLEQIYHNSEGRHPESADFPGSSGTSESEVASAATDSRNTYYIFNPAVFEIVNCKDNSLLTFHGFHQSIERVPSINSNQITFLQRDPAGDPFLCHQTYRYVVNSATGTIETITVNDDGREFQVSSIEASEYPTENSVHDPFPTVQLPPDFLQNLIIEPEDSKPGE